MRYLLKLRAKQLHLILENILRYPRSKLPYLFGIDTFIKESELKESFNIFFKIPKELYDKKIRQFRVIPNSRGDDFYVEFTYDGVTYQNVVTPSNVTDTTSTTKVCDSTIYAQWTKKNYMN